MRAREEAQSTPRSFSLSARKKERKKERKKRFAQRRERENKLNICLYILSVISDVFLSPLSSLDSYLPRDFPLLRLDKKMLIFDLAE
jgi:hypothetical protein